MLDLAETVYLIQLNELHAKLACLVKQTEIMKKTLCETQVSHMSMSQKSPYQKTLARLSTGLLAIKKLQEIDQAYQFDRLSPHSLHRILVCLVKFNNALLNSEKSEYTQNFITLRKLFSDLKVK